MSAPSAVHRLQAGARTARPRQFLDSVLHLFGFAEARTDRMPSGLSVHLGAPGETMVTMTDRREGEVRTYHFAADPTDLAERIAAVAARRGTRVKVLVDPAACFIRSVDLPSAALPRMRALLFEELEAATPFRAAAVYSDWFVESEDVATRMLRVRHVVLKKSRLDPLLEALSRAGLPVGPVAVGRGEGHTMPVDLLSHGHRALPALFSGGRTGDAVLLAGAALFLVLAFWGWRMHQDATLAALDEAFAATRRTTAPPIPAPVQVGLVTIRGTQAPPLVRTWDALATALPGTISATALHLDRAGALITVSAPSDAEAMTALARVQGFGPPVLRSAEDEPGRGRRLIVLLPALPTEG